MKPYKANLLNATVLIIMSLWGYFSSGGVSKTALIPVAFGIIFLALHPLFKKENKVVAHAIVVLTLLCLIGIIKPFTSQLAQSDSLGILRTGAMLITSAFALFVYIRSFMAARKSQ